MYCDSERPAGVSFRKLLAPGRPEEYIGLRTLAVCNRRAQPNVDAQDNDAQERGDIGHR